MVPSHLNTILFVCMANMHRSALAQYWLQQLLQRREQVMYVNVVRSAGLKGLPGIPGVTYAGPSQYPVEWATLVPFLSELGNDQLHEQMKVHLSHTLQEEDLRQARLILAMDKTVLGILCERFPEYSTKFDLFLGWTVGLDADVPNAGGSGESRLHRAATEIVLRAVESSIDRLFATLTMNAGYGLAR
jgi:protein-tyrosine-phosphatase